jgi:hypothetical protein
MRWIPDRPQWLPHLPLVFDTHPLELAMGAVLVVNGVRGLAFGYVSPSVDALPRPVWLLYLVVSTIGGIGAVVGLVLTDRGGRDFDRVATGLMLERSSLYLVAAAYASLGLVVVSSNGRAGLGTGILTCIIAFACWRRTKAIRRSARVVTRELRKLRLQQEQPDA